MKTGINNKVNRPSGPSNMGSQGTMRGPQGIDDLINEEVNKNLNLLILKDNKLQNRIYLKSLMNH